MPWGVSHRYKFIFLHIPKTAGTTICSSWEGSPLKHICKETGMLGGTHKTALQLRDEWPEEWERYTTFSVVRNPYDRFVSKFFFSALKPKQEFETYWDDKNSEGMMPQLYWLTDRETIYEPQSSYDRPDLHYGNIIVDRLLRYENLNDELYSLFQELGIDCGATVLPHFRTTCYPGTYPHYYNQELLSLVSYLYREDLERLGYEWPGEEKEVSKHTLDAFEQTYVREKMTHCPSCNHMYPLDDPAYGDHFFIDGSDITCHSCGYRWNDDRP